MFHKTTKSIKSHKAYGTLIHPRRVYIHSMLLARFIPRRVKTHWIIQKINRSRVSVKYASPISRVILLLAFKSLMSYALSRASNLICCTPAIANSANKHSLPDADDHRLLAEHTRVDFSLRARAIEKHFIYRLVPLSRITYLYAHEYVSVGWVWNFNALVTYSTNTTNTTERPVGGEIKRLLPCVR